MSPLLHVQESKLSRAKYLPLASIMEAGEVSMVSRNQNRVYQGRSHWVSHRAPVDCPALLWVSHIYPSGSYFCWRAGKFSIGTWWLTQSYKLSRDSQSRRDTVISSKTSIRGCMPEAHDLVIVPPTRYEFSDPSCLYQPQQKKTNFYLRYLLPSWAETNLSSCRNCT